MGQRRKQKRASDEKTIVISGINLFEGGPLSVYYDCLDAIRSLKLWKTSRVVAFVQRKELFQNYQDIAILIELPKSRRSYLHRLYYEYVYFYRFSCRHSIDIWFSLHDITPRVKAGKVYTYCHNPSPFLKKDFTKFKYGWKAVAFSCFYQYLYRANIKSASAVIVQQDWMRREFLNKYPVGTVVVAHPKTEAGYRYQGLEKKNQKTVFIYAAYPRYFKNFEQLLEASAILEKKGLAFETQVTLDGGENAYARDLRARYGACKQIRWLGLQPRETVFQLYDRSDCLVFPSCMETWGLPVSEYKGSGKPILLADLPYAHETVGDYANCSFFAVHDAAQLARLMQGVVEKNIVFHGNKGQCIPEPYFCSWEELLSKYICGENQTV